MSDSSVDAPTTATTFPILGTVGTPPAVDLAGYATVGDLTLDLRLKVEPGELVAVVGPNGAGKSTLLRLLAGLVRLNAGTLALGGRTVDNGTTRGFVPPHLRRVGWVPQDRLLFDHLTVAANVGFSPQATNDRVTTLLAALDLKALANRHPDECSGGQAQRVAVARALAAEPDVLLLDEPSAALDAGSRQRIHALLADPGPGGRQRPTILLVTHDPAEATGLADRVVELSSGRIAEGLQP